MGEPFSLKKGNIVEVHFARMVVGTFLSKPIAGEGILVRGMWGK